MQIESGGKPPQSKIMNCKWYNYYSDGQNPTSCCDSGEYYYFYDALGNVNGVLDSGTGVTAEGGCATSWGMPPGHSENSPIQ